MKKIYVHVCSILWDVAAGTVADEKYMGPLNDLAKSKLW